MAVLLGLAAREAALMGILRCFPDGSMLGSPFTDYLNVTTPLDNAEAVRSALVPLLESLGAFEEVAGEGFRFYEPRVVGGKCALVPDGMLKIKPRGKVLIVSASGAVLRRLRDRGVFPEYLAVLASFPHRVSMLHATADYHVLSPPAVIAQVKEAAAAGELSLTRKRLLPSQCTYLLGADCDGLETGTVYLGNKANADVWGKVYDKRHERLSRGYPEPGSIVRVEIAVQSDAGATLRDALQPRDLFYHFAGRSLVEVPPDFAGWSAHGEGYVLGERRERTLFERMDSLIEYSVDVAKVGAMAIVLYGDMAAQVIGRKVVQRGASMVHLYQPKPVAVDGVMLPA